MKLIHVAQIEGHRVRFYAPPPSEADSPWIVIEDVLALCSIPKGPRARLEASSLARKAHKMRDVSTAAGPLRLAPGWLAREIVKRAAGAGWVEWAVKDELAAEGRIALRKLLAAMPERERVPFARAIERRLWEREDA